MDDRPTSSASAPREPIEVPMVEEIEDLEDIEEEFPQQTLLEDAEREFPSLDCCVCQLAQHFFLPLFPKSQRVEVFDELIFPPFSLEILEFGTFHLHTPFLCKS